MLEECAIVVKIENGQTWVVGTQSNACAACAQQAGCSSNALASVLKKKPIPVDNELMLQIGDTVMVAVDESVLLRAAFLMYLLPLCALFIGAGITDSLISDTAPYGDVWVAVGALTGLALALFIMHTIQKYAFLNYYARPPVVVKKC